MGGFDDRLIAGEEPELCLRIRRAGWKVLRIDADMTFHDVDMRHFSQWWRRCVRAGFVVAEGIAMYGRDYPRRGALTSGLFWVLAWPGACATFALFAAGRWGLALAIPVALAIWLAGYLLFASGSAGIACGGAIGRPTRRSMRPSARWRSCRSSPVPPGSWSAGSEAGVRR